MNKNQAVVFMCNWLTIYKTHIYCHAQHKKKSQVCGQRSTAGGRETHTVREHKALLADAVRPVFSGLASCGEVLQSTARLPGLEASHYHICG
ncbi:hypothetical protein FKM82_018669 [Ascaphus truei]